MQNQLIISLFRFNYKTDYLPYYKNYTLDYQEEQNLESLLKTIFTIESFGFAKESLVSINGVGFDTQTPLSTIVEHCGTEWKIEPISTYRANEDLLMNEEDFYSKLNFFDEYLSTEDKAKYSTTPYRLAYYASNTLRLNRDYIGDHNLLIALDLIENNPSLQDDIVELIKDQDSGIWYHTHLNHQLLEGKSIEAKIQRLYGYCEIEYTPSASIEPTTINISKSFDGNVAIYGHSCATTLIPQLQATDITTISLTSQNSDVAFASNKVDRNFSMRIAGEILLEAKDSNAQILVVSNEQELALFDGMQSKIERVVGRDIAMPVVTYQEFISMLKGQANSSLEAHKVAIQAA